MVPLISSKELETEGVTRETMGCAVAAAWGSARDVAREFVSAVRAFVGRVWYETAPATSHHVRQAVARERDAVCASERTHHRGCESLTD